LQMPRKPSPSDRFPFERLTDALQADQSPEWLGITAKWLREFIAQPHEGLGRPGPICPCVVPALERDSILVGCLDIYDGENKRQNLVDQVLKYGDLFLEAMNNGEDCLDSLILAINGVEVHEYRFLLDGTYHLLRPIFLRKKLMFGRFHSLNSRGSRLNRNFYSLRAPIPLFAFRQLTLADGRNLIEEPESYKIYQEIYGLQN
jgi:tryptophan 2,3-dioxygenase